jgi:hypothetical protein
MTSTSETQQEALAVLADVWALSPDVRLGQLMALLMIAIVFASSSAGGDETAAISTSSRIPVAGGNMVVCWKTQTDTPNSVLVHFHGAPETVQHAYAASRYRGVLAIVNFSGLSSAYSSPVAEDAELFDRILARAWAESHPAPDEVTAPGWEEITLSSFSAGYGAVREILKSDADFERIDAIVAADSIYAGLESTSPTREVSADHMRDFLRFARLAADGKKRFVRSHSAQPTPYASTTETADYLLHALGVEREPETSIERDGMRQESRASRGKFLVLGFAGTTGQDHLRHLHNIDLLWDRCFSAEADGTRDQSQR